MREQRSLTALLRPNKSVRAVAIVAMLLQVAFAAAHISAGAIRSGGTAAPGTKLGFLEICTGGGILRIAPAGKTQGGDRTAACAVCASSCVSGFDQPAAIVAILPIATIEGAVVQRLAGTHTAGNRALSDGPIRAPPLFTL